MRVRSAILGVILFVVGVLVVPAVHRLHFGHCDCGHSESHNPGTCAICLVAATAAAIACVHVAAVPTQRLSEVVHLPEFSPVDIIIPGSCRARAPPRV